MERHCIRVASSLTERLKTWHLSKSGNIWKMFKLARDRTKGPVYHSEIKLLQWWSKITQKQKTNFSATIQFYLNFILCSKHYVQACRYKKLTRLENKVIFSRIYKKHKKGKQVLDVYNRKWENILFLSRKWKFLSWETIPVLLKSFQTLAGKIKTAVSFSLTL